MWMGNYFYTVTIYARYLSLATRRTTQRPRRRHSKQTQTKQKINPASLFVDARIRIRWKRGESRKRIKKNRNKRFSVQYFRLNRSKTQSRQWYDGEHNRENMRTKRLKWKWSSANGVGRLRTKKSYPICILHEAINGVRFIFHIFLLFSSSVCRYQ